MGKRSRIYDFSKEELQNILDNTNGLVPALKRLGVNGGSSVKTLKRIANELGLDLSKNNSNAKIAQRNHKVHCYPLDEILVEDSSYTNMERLKIRLFRDGLKENKCEKCGITSWNNKPISLQLHHKNGKRQDNRLENLQILCPNCHSQTENFGAYNSKNTINKKKK